MTVRYCRYWPFPVLWLVMAVTASVYDTTIRKNTEQSQTRCTQPFPFYLLRAQRVWESRPPKSPSAERHLHGYARDHVFGSVLATARFVCSTSADQVPCRRRRSRDCTAYICMHRLRTTTSNIHTRCLVWMEPLMMPWASISPHGTICYLYVYIFYFYLLLMWLVIHVCTYISSHNYCDFLD
jgi:hypothetical protein